MWWRVRVLLPWLLLLAILTMGQVSGIPSQIPATVLNSGTTFVTAPNILEYRAIVIGAGGGGGSSTGVGSGGSGASGCLTICEVFGNGTSYTYQIGTGGAAGAAGANGGVGTNTFFSDSTKCASASGNGGTAGTASAGAGGTICTATVTGNMATVGGNHIGASIMGVSGIVGVTGAGTGPNTFGAGMGGAGCAGASCVTDTAGTNGRIIMVPENN